jgi:hypothetical protein
MNDTVLSTVHGRFLGLYAVYTSDARSIPFLFDPALYCYASLKALPVLPLIVLYC